MKDVTKLFLVSAMAAFSINAAGQCDYQTPNGTWGNSDWYKIIDIDAEQLTDPSLPKFTGEDGKSNAADTDFSNGTFETPLLLNGEPSGKTTTVTYHMCAFAPTMYNSAYTKKVEWGEDPSGKNNPCSLNDNTVYQNILWDKPGFIELSRMPASAEAPEVSRHGYIEINNIPAVERVQWAYSSTAWGRGVKMDVKVGDGEWQELHYEVSDLKTVDWYNYTTFSEQGYTFEELIGLEGEPDQLISLRWRIWDGTDGEGITTSEIDPATGEPKIWYKPVDPLAQWQTVRIHQIKIFSGVDGGRANRIDAEKAEMFYITRSGDELSLTANANIEIYSVGGNVVKQEYGNGISLAGLPKGVYVVKATADNGVVKNMKVAL